MMIYNRLFSLVPVPNQQTIVDYTNIPLSRGDWFLLLGFLIIITGIVRLLQHCNSK